MHGGCARFPPIRLSGISLFSQLDAAQVKLAGETPGC
jgi:hypothetical protein